jgi:lysophospholipase L1-like esterase
MTGEPLFFVKEGALAPTARLLFKVTKDFRLTSPDGQVVYEEGRDYTLAMGSNIVTLTDQSQIPFKTHADIYPPRGAPNSYGRTVDGHGSVLWSEGAYFHNLAPLATYRHDESWTDAPPQPDEVGVRRTLMKLRAKQPLKLVILGDSISAGYNASGFVQAPPFQPGYAQLFADNLQYRFGASVKVTNLSVAGKASDWGITMAPKVIAENPDLVVIAFGMNDQGPATKFKDNIEKIIAAVTAGRPEADIILVSSMAGNSDLDKFPQAHFTSYRDALKSLRKPGVTVADVTSVWLEVVNRKSFLSLTGNGVNHPNDLGHRIYADVLTALFPHH